MVSEKEEWLRRNHNQNTLVEKKMISTKKNLEKHILSQIIEYLIFTLRALIQQIDYIIYVYKLNIYFLSLSISHERMQNSLESGA